MQKNIRAEKIFTGTEWLYNHEIIIEDGIIKALEPIEGSLFVKHDTETFLAPAFIDFQVYAIKASILQGANAQRKEWKKKK